MLIQKEVSTEDYSCVEEQVRKFELSLHVMTQSGFFDQEVLGKIEALCGSLLEPQSADISTADTQLIDRASLCPSLFLESEEKTKILVTFFGCFEISFQGERVDLSHHHRARQILKYLLLHRGERVPKEVLMDIFWTDLEASKARNNLNVTLYYLRKSLSDAGFESGLISTEVGCYFIEKGEYLWVDTERFKECREAAIKTLSIGNDEDGVLLLEEAMAYYCDSFLLEDRYEDWAVKLRQEIVRAYDGVLRMLRVEYVKAQRYEEAIELSNVALSKDPLDEVSLKYLMWCYQLLGLRHLAIRQYRRYTELLAEELGILPSQNLREAFMDMRAGREWSLD